MLKNTDQDNPEEDPREKELLFLYITELFYATGKNYVNY